jgi:ABC-type bacteriocin/lantibiotic exporters, contain an N-terminal double-glycine peptidase domain
LGGVKEIIILGRMSYFSKSLVHNSKILNKYRRDQFIISLIPNSLIEVFIISSIVFVLIFILAQGYVISEMLPLLSLYAVTAIRIRASVTKLITGFQLIDFSKVLGDTIILQLKQFSNKSTGTNLQLYSGKLKNRSSFKSSIKLNNISFHYKGVEKNAVNNINVTLIKGESAAFVGQTGAGKSTLIDIILGLLVPQQGQVLIDDCELEKCRDQWLSNIGYVPQSIYLTDDSLRNNVAFGISEELIDDDTVQKAISSAQLESFVSQLPEGK